MMCTSALTARAVDGSVGELRILLVFERAAFVAVASRDRVADDLEPARWQRGGQVVLFGDGQAVEHADAKERLVAPSNAQRMRTDAQACAQHKGAGAGLQRLSGPVEGDFEEDLGVLVHGLAEQLRAVEKYPRDVRSALAHLHRDRAQLELLQEAMAVLDP